MNNAQEHSLTAKFEMDELKYLARLGLQVAGDAETRAVYTPVLEYSGPDTAGKTAKSNRGGQDYHLDGKHN